MAMQLLMGNGERQFPTLIERSRNIMKIKKKKKAPPAAQAERGRRKTVNPQANKSEANDNTKANKKLDGARSVEFLGVGTSADGDRFLKARIGGHVNLISVAKLISNPSAEYVRLQRAGLPLLRRPARDRFIEQAEIEAGKEPTFLVATQPGLYRGKVRFPGDAVAEGQSDVEFYPDERHAPSTKNFSTPAPRKVGRS
jgi:hypothetical protein